MAGVVATASLMEERREQNANREQCAGKKERFFALKGEGSIPSPWVETDGVCRAPIFLFTRISIPPGYSILDSAFKIKNKKKITPSILPFMLEQLITNWTFYRVYNHPRLSQNPARFISPLSAIQNCSWKRVNRSRPGYIRQIARSVAGWIRNRSPLRIREGVKKGTGGEKRRKKGKQKADCSRYGRESTTTTPVCVWNGICGGGAGGTNQEATNKRRSYEKYR